MGKIITFIGRSIIAIVGIAISLVIVGAIRDNIQWDKVKSQFDTAEIQAEIDRLEKEQSKKADELTARETAVQVARDELATANLEIVGITAKIALAESMRGISQAILPRNIAQAVGSSRDSTTSLIDFIAGVCETTPLWNRDDCHELKAKILGRCNTRPSPCRGGSEQLLMSEFVQKEIDSVCDEARFGSKSWCELRRGLLNRLTSLGYSVRRAGNVTELSEQLQNQEEKIKAAVATLLEAEKALASARVKSFDVDSQLRAKTADLKRIENDPARFLYEKIDQLVNAVIGVLAIAVILWAVPYLFFIGVWFFAKKVSRLKPTRFSHEVADSEIQSSGDGVTTRGGDGGVRTKLTSGKRTVSASLEPDERIWLRPDYVRSAANGVGSLFPKWVRWYWAIPLKMAGSTKYSGAKSNSVEIGGTGPEHADEYIATIDLVEHPGFVIRPSALIAVKMRGGEGPGEPPLVIRTRWNWSLAALLRGHIRYLIVNGTGTIYLAGLGTADGVGVDAEAGEAGLRQIGYEQVLGWDARLDIHAIRNENFFATALARSQGMCETRFSGTGIYVTTHGALDVGPRGARSGGGFVSDVLDIFLGFFGIR